MKKRKSKNESPVQDHCSILGVSRTASTQEIHDAYRRKAKEVHPDRGGRNEDFCQLKEAYTALSNPTISAVPPPGHLAICAMARRQPGGFRELHEASLRL